MKLTRCHIENFGVLSNFDFTFSSGLNTICEDNGFGKSTFAAFIKAMLYGMPRTGARNIVDNERKRYDPWQGGSYGGFLEFEAEGIGYRVTRYFGKTAAKDSFSLMDLTHRQMSGRFTEKLGEELFQLDADAFSRSTYMAQSAFRDMEITTSLRTKLSHLVDDTNDLNNFDTAEKKLREYRAHYRAYRGDSGRIRELENRLHRLEEDRDQAALQRPRLAEMDAALAALDRKTAEKKQRIETLRKTMQRSAASEAYHARREQLADLRQDLAAEEKRIQTLDQKYPAGYPSIEEIRAQRKNLSLILTESAPESATEDASARMDQQFRLIRMLTCVGIFFLLVAILLLLLRKPVSGILLALLGLLSFFMALWLRSSTMQPKRKTSRRDDAFMARKARAEEALEDFLEQYRLPGDTPENLLYQAERDLGSREDLERRRSEAKQKLRDFLLRNPDLRESDTQRAALPKLAALQAEEKGLQKELEGIEVQRSAQQKAQEKLRDIVEKIPAWEDEMARVQTELQEDRQKCALAEQTLALLQQAKDNLANGYVGKIEAGFRKYADILLDGRLGDAILDKDLQLHIDEKGAARELGSFSAGTADSIALCLRLSLIDALFEKEKPFLILDDPFVNFDDTRMRRALEMLRKLAEEHQIVYLVCNSNRR